LGPGVRRAVITENVMSGSLRVANQAGAKAIIANNSSQE